MTYPADEQSTLIVPTAEVDPSALFAFFEQAFGTKDARFLSDHGDWISRHTGMRFVALCDGVVAGYRAATPAALLFQGQEIRGVWARDLYVSPAFRGGGLQRLLDQRVMEAGSLRMSFPNELGAKIYLKQGYGLREDVTKVVAPLHLRRLSRVQTANGPRGLVIKAAALGLSPPVAAYRAWALRYRPKRTEVMDSPDPRELEAVFHRYAGRDLVTTIRSPDHLQWRYCEGPFPSESTFYLTGPPERPTHYAIVRYLPHGAFQKARILDIFGDFRDGDGLADLLRTIVRDAVVRGAAQVEALASWPPMTQATRRAGFRSRGQVRFRWLADDPSIHERFRTAQLHWTVGGRCYRP
jgi:GNAT superfamily N-acetyltransferase